MKLKPDQKLLILISVIGSFALLIVLTIILPTVAEIRKADQETYDLRVYLEKKYNRSVSAHESLEEIERIKPNVATFDAYVFHKGNELKLITLLEDLALHASVTQKINSSNLDQVTDQQVTISLSLNGTYHNILGYLGELERAPYFINITRLSLSPSNDRTDPSKSTVNLNLNVSLYVAN